MRELSRRGVIGMRLSLYTLCLFLAALLTVDSGVAVAYSDSADQGSDQQAKQHPPKLTILIALDQFRASYLIEYDEAFAGGFRRLLDHGVCYKKAIVDHAPTLSLPGHTTLATGANPRTHGITSNAWLDPESLADDKGVLHAIVPHLDTSVKIVGDDQAHAFSPYRVKVEGIADWFRKSDAKARTVALSVSPLLSAWSTWC